jgi:hypothetical protein
MSNNDILFLSLNSNCKCLIIGISNDIKNGFINIFSKELQKGA